MVIDTDGSAFITKAEFDSLKNNFQAQIDSYNSAIDSKIDGAIASYLSGIQMASEFPQIIPWGSSGVQFKNIPDKATYGSAQPAMIYRPFSNKLEGFVTLSNYNDYDTGKLLENDPGFIADFFKLPLSRGLYINDIGTPAKAQMAFCPTFDADTNPEYGGSWRDWYCTGTRTKAELAKFWWDSLTYSEFLTEDQNGYRIVKALGRGCVAPSFTMLAIVKSNSTWTASKANMDDDWDACYHKINGVWYKSVNSLQSLRSSIRSGQWSAGPYYEYLHKTATMSTAYYIDKETNMLSCRVQIGPIVYTNSSLTGISGLHDAPADWVFTYDGFGWSDTWTSSIVNKDQVKTEPVVALDKLVISKNTGTTVTVQKTPSINCGEILVNEDYGGQYFDVSSLWCKEPMKRWLEGSLMEWQLGFGPYATAVEDICDNSNINYKFGGQVGYMSGVFGPDSGSAYAREDCADDHLGEYGYDLGHLPVLRITPLDSEKKMITDFYAPLYGNDTMSPYGKSYVDGACICKVATDGDNLRVKLKSTEETTLYFNKNPFTTCDAAGNVGYIANGTPYSAGSGVHVNANEAITIDIKNVLAEDRYYVKPDTATTIQFESAVITQDS